MLPVSFHSNAMSIVMDLFHHPVAAPAPSSSRHSCTKPPQSVNLLVNPSSNQQVLATPQLNKDVTCKDLSLIINLRWCFCGLHCLEELRVQPPSSPQHQVNAELKVQCPRRHSRTDLILVPQTVLFSQPLLLCGITEDKCVYTNVQESLSNKPNEPKTSTADPPFHSYYA